MHKYNQPNRPTTNTHITCTLDTWLTVSQHHEIRIYEIVDNFVEMLLRENQRVSALRNGCMEKTFIENRMRRQFTRYFQMETRKRIEFKYIAQPKAAVREEKKKKYTHLNLCHSNKYVAHMKNVS